MTTLARNPICEESTPSFFESESYVLIFTHIVTIISIPVSAYAFYCIIYVTPPNMRNARKHLLNLHFWTVIFDVLLNILIVPFIFFPTTAVVTLGYGYNIGLPSRFQLYLIQAIACVIASAMNGLFENRFSSVATNPIRIQKTWIRVALYVSNYCVACISVIPPYLKAINLDEIRMDVLKIVPCPSIELFSSRLAVVHDDPSYVTIFMTIQSVWLVPQAGFFPFFTAYLLVYRPNASVSESTRKMQFTFLIAVFLQCAIPFLFLVLPTCYIWLSALIQYYNAACNNHVVTFASLHGLCSTLCLLAVHRPYRDHFLSNFKTPRLPKLAQVSSNVIT